MSECQHVFGDDGNGSSCYLCGATNPTPQPDSWVMIVHPDENAAWAHTLRYGDDTNEGESK
jgi:hypothetical protein